MEKNNPWHPFSSDTDDMTREGAKTFVQMQTIEKETMASRNRSWERARPVRKLWNTKEELSETTSKHFASFVIWDTDKQLRIASIISRTQLLKAPDGGLENTKSLVGAAVVKYAAQLHGERENDCRIVLSGDAAQSLEVAKL